MRVAKRKSSKRLKANLIAIGVLFISTQLKTAIAQPADSLRSHVPHTAHLAFIIRLIDFAEALRLIESNDPKAIDKLTALIEKIQAKPVKVSTSQDDVVFPLLLSSTKCGEFSKRLLVDVLISRATLYGDAKKYDLAAKDFQKVLELCPESAQGHAALAKVQLKMGNCKKSISEADLAIELKKDLHAAYYTRALAKKQLGLNAEAEKDNEKANEINNRLRNEIGELRGRMHNLSLSSKMSEADKASTNRMAKTILTKARRDPRAINDYAHSLYFMTRFEDAINYVSVAIALNPKDPVSLQLRSGCWLQLHRPELALADANKVLALSPNSPTGWNNKATALLQLNRFDEAVEAFNIVVLQNPDSASTLSSRSYLYCNLDKPELAAHDAQKALMLRPDVPDPYYNLGLALCRQGKWRGAKEALETTIKYSRKMTIEPYAVANAHYRLAIALSHLDKPDLAEQHINKALLSEPNFPALLETHAVAYARAGFEKEADSKQAASKSLELAKRLNYADLEDVVRLTTTMIKMSPAKPDPFYLRAIAYLCLGKTAEAARDFKKMSELRSAQGNPSAAAASFAYLCYQRLKDRQTADAILQTMTKYSNNSADNELISYLKGSLSEQAFLNEKDPMALTRRHCIVGFNLENAGKRSDAKKHFEYVVYKGNKQTNEFLISTGELKKMAK